MISSCRPSNKSVYRDRRAQEVHACLYMTILLHRIYTCIYNNIHIVLSRRVKIWFFFEKFCNKGVCARARQIVSARGHGAPDGTIYVYICVRGLSKINRRPRTRNHPRGKSLRTMEKKKKKGKKTEPEESRCVSFAERAGIYIRIYTDITLQPA